jgi:hypothetical protein
MAHTDARQAIDYKARHADVLAVMQLVLLLLRLVHVLLCLQT